MNDHRSRPILITPITSVVAISAVGVSVWWWTGGDVEFLTLDFRVWSQPWRLVTAVLPHIDVIHLVFNIYWLFVFGGRLESEFGSFKTALTFLLLGVGSSLADYAFSYSGVGLSGIGYGLFGLLWVLGRNDARFSGVVDAKVVQLFVFWFLLCVALTVADVWHVANVAHGAGAVFGGVLGWCVVARSLQMRLASRLLLLGLLVSVVLASSISRPYVNFTGIVANEYAYLGYRALEDGDPKRAVRFLAHAVEVEPDDGATWFNLGIAYYRSDRFTDAVAACERAIQLSPNNDEYKNTLAELRAFMAR